MSMSSSNLALLTSRLDKSKVVFIETYRSYKATENETDEEIVKIEEHALQEGVKRTLRAVCDVAREGAREKALEPDDLQKLLRQASDLEAFVATAIAAEPFMLEYLPISCGNDVTDESMGTCGLGGNHAALLIGMLKGMTDTNLDRDHMASILEVAAGGNAEPYDPASKPSPHTTPLARFSSKRPLVPTDAEPELRAFAEARCEIDQIDIAFPFQLAKTESAVAALCATGGKPRERSTVVRIYSLDLPEPERGYPRYISVPVRMSSGSLGEHILLDDTRKTLYVGNGSQIQSFVYTFDGIDQKDTGEFKSGHGTAPMRNIFNAAGYGGAMTTIRDGSRLLRSGKKGLAVWNMEPGKLPLPGSKDVAAPRQMITSPAMTGISVWTEHPSEPLQRIAAYDHRYGATLVTFQTQQIVTRYVGHGGFIRDIQTSADDANTFITAAEDGAVRMYDVRLPTPVLAIYHRDEPIRAALYQHIHQQPFVILGGTKSEQVKVWDVRAKLPLYELSTGNNQVNALAWDEPRQTLYAATECCYKDRNGYRIGYRAAQFPDSGEDDRRTWPEQAYHSETSFGYPLDSCDQRLYRYTFKEDADVTVLPSYGPS